MSLKNDQFKLSDVVPFGMFKGMTFEDAISIQPEYFFWMNDEEIAALSEEVLNYAEQQQEIHHEIYQLLKGDI